LSSYDAIVVDCVVGVIVVVADVAVVSRIIDVVVFFVVATVRNHGGMRPSAIAGRSAGCGTSAFLQRSAVQHKAAQ